jgi:hypothetical protein
MSKARIVDGLGTSLAGAGRGWSRVRIKERRGESEAGPGESMARIMERRV